MGSAAVGGEKLIRRLIECPKGRNYNELQILKRGAMDILSIQVGQPKSYGVADGQPCQTLARKFRVRDMVKRVLQRQAFGWYLRVRHDGWLEPGMVFQLQDRPYPHWTVKEVERVMRHRAHEPEAARRLAECPVLADDWRAQLAGRGAATGTE